MVGDDPHPHVRLVVGAVFLPGELFHQADDRAEQVRLVDVVHALQQEGQPLDAEPGVDVLLRQRTENREIGLLAVTAARRFAAHVLHEDQVPDLQVPVLVGDRSALDTEFRAAVVIDLRARSAGTGNPHRPEIVGHAAPLDAFRRNAGHALPQPFGLVIGLVHGDPQPIGVQPVTTLVQRPGQQIPGVLDRTLLEVVAEGEIPGHLKEGVVPLGDPDVLDIQGPHTFLHAGRTRERRFLLAEEVRLERHHAGDREQQRRVLADQRGRRHDGVTGLLEVAEKATPDLVGFHGSSLVVGGDGRAELWRRCTRLRRRAGAGRERAPSGRWR